MIAVTVAVAVAMAVAAMVMVTLTVTTMIATVMPVAEMTTVAVLLASDCG